MKNKDVKVLLDMNKGQIHGSMIRISVNKLHFTLNDLVWSFKKEKIITLNGSGKANCNSDNVRLE